MQMPRSDAPSQSGRVARPLDNIGPNVEPDPPVSGECKAPRTVQTRSSNSAKLGMSADRGSVEHQDCQPSSGSSLRPIRERRAL